MKKNIFYLAIVILGIMQVQSIQAQMLGKWIIPTNISEGEMDTYELVFYENSFSYTALGIPSINVDVPAEFSAGGYDDNYNRDFYIIGKNIYNGSTPSPWIGGTQDLNPDYQIIKKPQSPNEYYSIFSHYKTNDGFWLSYNIIDVTGTPPVSNEIFMREFDEGYAAHAVSEEQNILYVVRTKSDDSNPEDGGLYQWTISSTEISNETLIFGDENTPLGNDDFNAYNLELNLHNNTETVLAWVNPDPDLNVTEDKIIIVKDGNYEIYNINQGKIGGIEFSSLEDNVMYASCSVGILKIDYTDLENPVYTTIAGSANYARTFLQTAPDGHIYGVSNDGSHLRRINMGTGNLDPTLYPFPNYGTVSTYRMIWDGTNQRKFFVLPENERVHTPLNVTVNTVNTDCPDDPYGEVTIYVSGGVPFTSPDDPYEITSPPPSIDYEWDDDLQAFIADGLTAGIYSFTVNDNGGNFVNRTFEIRPTNDFELTYFHIYEGDHEFPSTAYPETNYTFEKGIYIHADPENGITPTLTINNSTFEFGVGAKIIIEPGAKLIVNNSVLTNWHCVPDSMWQGVEVWGISDSSQVPRPGEACYQGKLVLDNATIQNSILAVDLWKPNYYSKTGGIVIADDAHFINNARALRALHYNNIHPTNPIVILDNLSHFYKCDFDINTDYIGSQTFYKHIDLSNVKGFSFRGCDFTNDATNNIPEWNSAIMAMDAGFTVENYDHIPPIESNLSGFYTAIWAANERTTNTFLVQDANFVNNAIGIRVNAVNNVAVISSSFNLGLSKNPFAKGICFGTDISYGIDMLGSIGFAIEDNNFTTSQTTGEYIGVRVLDCPSESDDIYRNEYVGLSVANLAEGDNRSNFIDDATGVSYLCNQNSINDYDFYVAYESWIRGNVGTTTNPSGNVITNPSSSIVQLQNDFTQDIRYYYNVNNTNEWLVEYSNYVYPFAINYANLCPPHYGGGGGFEKSILLTPEETQEAEQDFATNLIDFNNVEVLFNSLKDGGSTDAMISEVEMSWPQDMWELRAELLGSSPHLSKEVLITAADKTDVLPESILFDILASNPDELRKEELISHLENKDQPLPDYMIDILEQVANGISYKTVLIDQRSDFHHKKVNAAQDIIRSILNDSIMNRIDFRNWLDNLGGYVSDKQIISSYMQEGDINTAQSLLNILPDLYNLNGNELLAYNDYKTIVEMQMDIDQQGRNIFTLSETELNVLSSIADNGYGTAKFNAQGLLKYAYGNEYCNCPSLPEPIELKSSNDIAFGNFIKTRGLEIDAKPNPASSWVAFSYKLPASITTATIIISDMTGKVIKEINIDDAHGQKIWDVRDVKAGAYIYSIKTANISKRDKIIVQ